MTIADRLTAVTERMATAAERARRDPGAVRLVAISKTFGLAEIAEAHSAGQAIFGENRAQELASKYREIAEEIAEGIEWHFVGTLQTNKVKQVVGTAALIHSVDSIRLAEAIGKRAEGQGIRQAVLIEVNVAGDARKAGVDPAAVPRLIEEIGDVSGVRVRGLMTMPPIPAEPEDSRPYYKELASLGADLGNLVADPVELSMGMTRDFEVAIEEGATLIRVGEAVFGPRPARS
jgi:PLP dependent protein